MENQEKDNYNLLYDFIENATSHIMQRFDEIEQALRTIAPKSMRTITYFEGERLYDNQDLCEMFGKSKRSLQRYRSDGLLPYLMIKHSAHYKESHVESFKKVLVEESEQKQQQKNKEKDYAT